MDVRIVIWRGRYGRAESSRTVFASYQVVLMLK